MRNAILTILFALHQNPPNQGSPTPRLRLAQGLSGKSACNGGDSGFDPWVRMIPWRGTWQPAPVYLPGEPHGQRKPGGLQSMGLQSRT